MFFNFLKNGVFKTHKGVFCTLTPSSNPKLNSPNPLRAPYEKLSLTQVFYFGCENAQRYFLDFITNIQNKADILKPYKDQ
ncbi:hypothetical protein FIM48_01760 [Helicobacter pylori]|nr:hypothetical protein FIM48_01760 [Helicobacter pylori]